MHKGNLLLAAGALVYSMCALTSHPASAASVTLTMDEVATQPINGLSITKGFETFTFADPLGTLFYHSIGPGTLTYVQDPSIQGFLQSFSVSFSVPVSSISFGLAESSSRALTGAQVLLSNGSSHSFDLTLVDPFAEAQFTWSGSAITGFTLTPAPGALALAFDNLTVTSAVPEASTWAMMILGFCGLGFAGYKQARRRAVAA